MTFRLTCIFMKKLNCIWQFCQKSLCYSQKLFVFSWLAQILQKMSGVYWYPQGRKAHWLNFQHHYQCPYDSSFQQNHPGIVLINLINHSPLWKLLQSTAGYPEKNNIKCNNLLISENKLGRCWRNWNSYNYLNQ